MSGIAPRSTAIQNSGLEHEVIMVVHPSNVHEMSRNFAHIADLGFARIQINFALGAHWSRDHQERFAAELHRVATDLERREAFERPVHLVNLSHFGSNSPHLPVNLTRQFSRQFHTGVKLTRTFS